MSRYAKAIVAFVMSISAWGVTAAPGGIDGAEWFGLMGALGATAGVYAVPNTPPAGKLRDPDISEAAPGH